MTRTFRHFIKSNDFYCSILEQDAAPAMGAAPAPPQNPASSSTTNKNHFDQIQQQFGIDDSELQAALEGGTIPVFISPDYSKSWGFLVVGPCTATVVASKDGNYEVTFQLEEKKHMNPKAFILPYKQGETPVRYQGEVTNKTVTMTPEELQDIVAMPFTKSAGGGSAPAGMPALGGL